MKFSEIASEQWEELAPYLDTCLLPVTGLSGGEKPHEATQRLERLRDLLDLIEIPFKGRIVTYPAWHYANGANWQEALNGWCEAAKKSGFRYVIVASANQALELREHSADLCFLPDEDGKLPKATEVSETVRALWSGQAAESEAGSE
ncbi:DUF2487 family protein [Paenibacillus arenilitoris]|uniref:DUF2487 family protein n=1 Tax=Paenibacillus arenilitoris TaxID=2772299 RepID=A0A927CN91_9BACL|nr:DUF2487 family protein [Paenibacillus arenilitoris]MBD2869678.1 DUF2487 family protein [Paenibacillus arenilitoris]